MNINKMSNREQFLVFATAATLILGAYGLFRFYPANKAIATMNNDSLSMEAAVKTSRIPDAPFEDAKSLEKEMGLLDKQLEDAKLMTSEVERRLSGPDTTAARIAISDIARQALIRIVANEEFNVAAKPSAAPGANTASQAPRRNFTRSDQARQRRNARAAAARNPAAAAGYGASRAMTRTTVSPTTVTPLVASMGAGAAMERPLQRLTLEGTFGGMLKFIQGLEEMNQLVTVVQLQLGVAPQTPPPGYNQRLSATLVIAL